MCVESEFVFDYRYLINTLSKSLTQAKPDGVSIDKPKEGPFPQKLLVLLWSMPDNNLYNYLKTGTNETIVPESFIDMHSMKKTSKTVDTIAEKPLNHAMGVNYWVDFCNRKYRLGFESADMDYVNCMAYSLIWYGTKICFRWKDDSDSVDLLRSFWELFWSEFVEQIRTVGEKETISAFDYAMGLRNNDLYNIFVKIDKLLSTDERELNLEKDDAGEEKRQKIRYCNESAGLFLQMVAVSVMLTKQVRTNPRIADFEYRKPIVEKNSFIINNYALHEERERLIREYKSVVLALLNEKNGGCSDFNLAEAELYIKQIMLMINRTKAHSEYMVNELDYYFRDLFFFAVNNPKIQKKLLFRSFSTIDLNKLMDIYTEWVEHIVLMNQFDLERSSLQEYVYDSMLMRYDLIDRFVIDRLVADEYDTVFSRNDHFGVAHELRLRRAVAEDIDEIYGMHINAKSCGKAIYIPSEKPQLEYGLTRQNTWVITDNEKIVCMAVIIPKVEVDDAELMEHYQGLRLCREKHPNENYGEFNSIIVSDEYKGFGFQRLMISLSIELSRQNGCDFVLATVSKGNEYSYDNFMRMGFRTEHIVKFRFLEPLNGSDMTEVEYSRHLVRLDL